MGSRACTGTLSEELTEEDEGNGSTRSNGATEANGENHTESTGITETLVSVTPQ